MGAYKSHIGRPTTSDHKQFNIRMFRLRIEVEHAFAIHANLKSVIEIGYSPAMAYYLVAININYLQENQTLKRVNVALPTLGEYLHIDENLEEDENDDN